MGIHYHECEVCHKIKPFGNIQATTCKDCQDSGYKYCTRCKQIKPTTEFSWNKANQNYRAECKICYSRRGCESEKELYQTDRVYHLKRNANSAKSKKICFAKADYVERQKYYTRTHNYNARKMSNGGKHTTEEWLDCTQAFNNECAYCGTKHNLTRDHIIPLIKGGYNYIYNIVPACSSCNSSKQAHDIVEWYTKQPFYSEERLLNIHKWYRAKQKELLDKYRGELNE